MRKYRMLREALSASPCIDMRSAPLAPVDAIELAHDPAYVHGFLEGSLPARVMRRIGFPWSQGLVDRTLASAGSTLQSAFDVMEKGDVTENGRMFAIAGGLSGGTHHAFRAEGSGFCVFNDIAIAILALRKAGVVRRAAVIDLDVHQGDGTAAIFSGDRTVFTFSMHGANNFPFRKQQSSLDIELPDGTGDEVYLEKLRESLDAVWQFGPEVVFYQSGVDALHTDRLGRLKLTHAGLQKRDRLVLEPLKSLGIPTVLTLGGGYSDPIEYTVQAHAATFLMAAEMAGSVPGQLTKVNH